MLPLQSRTNSWAAPTGQGLLVTHHRMLRWDSGELRKFCCHDAARTRRTSRGNRAMSARRWLDKHGYTVGTVPPSITCSEPDTDAARGDTRKVIRSATSVGVAGRPTGIPPSQSMTIFFPPS